MVVTVVEGCTAAMIRSGNASVAVAVPRASDAPLLADEARYVLGASRQRFAEYATARGCARTALIALGGPRRMSILGGTRGQPVWPTGFVGSLSHCSSLAGAVVARAQDYAAVGIDIEPNDTVDQEVTSSIMSPSEEEHLRRIGASAWRPWLFNAKESILKCVDGLGVPLGDPREIEVRIDPRTARFRGYIPGGSLDDFALTGRFTTLGRWGIAICTAQPI